MNQTIEQLERIRDKIIESIIHEEEALIAINKALVIAIENQNNKSKKL